MKIFTTLLELKHYEEKYHKIVLTLKDLEHELTKELIFPYEFDVFYSKKIIEDAFYSPSDKVGNFAYKVIELLYKEDIFKKIEYEIPEHGFSTKLWDGFGNFHFSFDVNQLNLWIEKNIIPNSVVEVLQSEPDPLPDDVTWSGDKMELAIKGMAPIIFNSESVHGQLFKILIEKHNVLVKHSEIMQKCVNISNKVQIRSGVNTLKKRKFHGNKRVAFETNKTGSYKVKIHSKL